MREREEEGEDKKKERRRGGEILYTGMCYIYVRFNDLLLIVS